MSYFSDYLSTILSAGMCAFICESICKSFGASKSLNRTLNTITSLLLFSVIVLPLGSIIKKTDFITQDYPALSQQNREENTSLIEFTVIELESSIKEKIFDETGIYPETVVIDYISNTDVPQISKVNITVKNISDSEKNRLSLYLETLFGSKTQVEITET